MLSLILVLFVPVVLTQDVIPINYKIELIPNLTTLKFAGEVTIQLLVQTPIDKITLDAKNLDIATVSLTDQTGTEIPDLNFTLGEDTESVDIDLPSSLSLELYNLKVNYNGVINTNHEGFYVSQYPNATGGNSVFALTNLKFTHARQVFPCFDHPKYPATFQLSLIRPSTYASLANTPKSSESVTEDGVRETFATTDPIPTYLVSFAIFDFPQKGTNEFPVYQIVESGTEFLFDYAQKITETFKSLYPVRLGKIQQVVLPDGALPADVLANPGLIFYRESAVIFQETVHTTREKQQIIENIAYAISHQWYTEADSSKWWSNLWLAEAITNMYKYEILEKLFSQWEFTNQLVIEKVSKMMEEEADPNGISLTLTENDSPEDLNQLFAEKAFAILRMYTHLSLPGDILSIGEESLIKSWTDNVGYPSISVKRDINNNILTLSQETPLRSIPVNILEQGQAFDSAYDVILENPSQNYSLSAPSSTWYLVNLDRFGYFHVNYDDENWNSLITFLKTEDINEITPINRALLVEAALRSAEQGLLSYTKYLELLQYAQKETDYFPIHTLIETTTRLKNLLWGSSRQSTFLNYVRNIAEHLFDHVGSSIVESDSHLEHINRIKVLLWLCNFGHEGCQRDMGDVFANTQALHPDLQEAVLCGAIRHGGVEVFMDVYQVYEVQKKAMVVKSLGCTSNTELITEILVSVVNESSISFEKEHEVDAILAVIDGSDTGVEHTLSILKQNLETFIEKFSYSEVETIFTALSKRLLTQDHLDMVVAVTECLNESQKVEYNTLFDSVQSTIQRNMRWTAGNLNTIENWLDENVKNDSSTTTEVPQTGFTPSDNTTSTTESPGSGIEMKNFLSVSSFILAATLYLMFF